MCYIQWGTKKHVHARERSFIFELEIDLVSFSIDNKCGNVRIKLGKLISKFNLQIYLFTCF